MVSTNNETKKRLDILNDPDLFERINKEFDKKIVGEEETRKTIFLVANLRNVENKKPTSSNLLVNGETGAGKDLVAGAVFDILPKNEMVHKHRITPKTLAYLNNKAKDKTATWSKKALLLEDTPNNVINDDSFKVFSSCERLNQTFIMNQTPVNFETDCKPAIIMTSAEAEPKSEMLRRFPIKKMDESVDQTKAIIQRKIEYEMSGISTEYDPLIIEALGELGIIKVKIPFAEKLKQIFSDPKIHLIARTSFDRFLDYIRSSTALHQYQRKQEDGYFLATAQDYEIGRAVFLSTTSNSLMIPVTRLQQEIIDKVKSLKDEFYTINELEKHFTCSVEWLRKQLDKLVKHGFFEKGERDSDKDTNKKYVTYKFKGMANIKIPTFEELEE